MEHHTLPMTLSSASSYRPLTKNTARLHLLAAAPKINPSSFMKLSQSQALRKVMLRACSAVSLLACATFVAPQTARATAYTWDGLGANFNWNTTGNWSPTVNPSTTADTATITGGTGNPLLNGNYTVGGFTLGTGKTFSPSSSATVKLTMDAGASPGTIAFSNAGTISSDKGGIFWIHFAPSNGSASAVNTGTLEAKNSSTLRFASNSGKDLTLNNTGGIIQTVGSGSTIEFNPNTGYGENIWIRGGTISNAAGSTILSSRQIQLGASGNKVSAAGTIFNNAGTFTWSTPSNLVSGNMGAGITFSLLTPTTGSTEFNNASTGIANFTSNLVAGTTVVQLASLSVSAGTTFSNAGIVNITTDGNGGNAIQGMRMAVAGTTAITNTGTINLISKSTGNTTDFNASTAAGTVSLSGSGGKLVMQVGVGGAVDRVGISGVATSTIINSAGHTISGAGTVGSNSLGTLTNNGTINADDATYAMTLDPYQYLAGANTNAGTIRASAGGGLKLGTGVFNNNATGIYQVDSGSSLTLLAGSVLNNNTSGTFTVNGTLSSAANAGTINNASLLTINSSADSTLNALLTGAGTLVKSGSGNLTLGGANTMTGGVTVNNGTLNVSTGSASSKTISITSSTTSNAGLVTVTTGNTSGLVVGQAITGANIAADTVITGIIDSANFTISKAVTTTITASSRDISALSYSTLGTGPVTVTGGTLDLGAGSHQVGAVSLTGGAINNGTLTGSSYAVQNGSISASLSGSGIALTKTNSGTVTLSNTNTYTGATQVNGGTLVVNGSLASGSAVSIGASGTLGGSGTVGGTVAVSGTISPGNSPGLLTTGAQTWSNGGNYNWQVVNAAGSAGTGFDSIAISSGGLNLSGLTTGGFSINLWSLSSIEPDVNGNATSFDNSINQTWTLVSNTGDLTSFVGSLFNVNVSANNGTNGFTNALGGGSFSVVGMSNSLDLVFTAAVIPEPTTYAAIFGALALTGVVCKRRRRA